jgi:invasion protein IalB
MLPFDILAPGMIDIDGETQIQLHYPGCYVTGCIALAKLDAARLVRFRAAHDLAHVNTDVTGKELRVPFATRGLAKALDGEPLSEECMSREEKFVQQFVRAEGTSPMVEASKD